MNLILKKSKKNIKITKKSSTASGKDSIPVPSAVIPGPHPDPQNPTLASANEILEKVIKDCIGFNQSFNSPTTASCASFVDDSDDSLAFTSGSSSLTSSSLSQMDQILPDNVKSLTLEIMQTVAVYIDQVIFNGLSLANDYIHYKLNLSQDAPVDHELGNDQIPPLDFEFFLVCFLLVHDGHTASSSTFEDDKSLMKREVGYYFTHYYQQQHSQKVQQLLDEEYKDVSITPTFIRIAKEIAQHVKVHVYTNRFKELKLLCLTSVNNTCGGGGTRSTTTGTAGNVDKFQPHLFLVNIKKQAQRRRLITKSEIHRLLHLITFRPSLIPLDAPTIKTMIHVSAKRLRVSAKKLPVLYGVHFVDLYGSLFNLTCFANADQVCGIVLTDGFNFTVQCHGGTLNDIVFSFDHVSAFTTCAVPYYAQVDSCSVSSNSSSESSEPVDTTKKRRKVKQRSSKDRPIKIAREEEASTVCNIVHEPSVSAKRTVKVLSLEKQLEQKIQFLARELPQCTMDGEIGVEYDAAFIRKHLNPRGDRGAGSGDINIFLPNPKEIVLGRPVLLKRGRVGVNSTVGVKAHFFRKVYGKKWVPNGKKESVNIRLEGQLRVSEDGVLVLYVDHLHTPRVGIYDHLQIRDTM